MIYLYSFILTNIEILKQKNHKSDNYFNEYLSKIL